MRADMVAGLRAWRDAAGGRDELVRTVLDAPSRAAGWESGRLLARSGVLAGDTVHTLRTRAWQDRPDVHR